MMYLSKMVIFNSRVKLPEQTKWLGDSAVSIFQPNPYTHIHMSSLWQLEWLYVVINPVGYPVVHRACRSHENPDMETTSMSRGGQYGQFLRQSLQGYFPWWNLMAYGILLVWFWWTFMGCLEIMNFLVLICAYQKCLFSWDFRICIWTFIEI